MGNRLSIFLNSGESTLDYLRSSRLAKKQDYKTTFISNFAIVLGSVDFFLFLIVGIFVLAELVDRRDLDGKPAIQHWG